MIIVSLLPFTARPLRLDVGFVVDSSDSVNWSKMQRFVISMVESFDIAKDRVHVGFVSFSDKAVLSFSFFDPQRDTFTRDSIKQQIRGITQLGGSQRRVDLALNTAYRDLFSNHDVARRNARKVFWKLCKHIVDI